MDNNLLKAPTILISRTDGIGDVILSLPIAGVLKTKFPDCKIIFLGKQYTKPIIEMSEHIHKFIDWEQIVATDYSQQIQLIKEINADIVIHVFPNKQIARLCKAADIPTRIGTSHRIFHWLTCNRLVNLGRKNSDLHESQLNLRLLEPLGYSKTISLSEMPTYLGLQCTYKLPPEIETLLDSNKINLVLHPFSKGSSREWGLDNYKLLIELLSPEKYNIFIAGSEAESQRYKAELVNPYDYIHDVGGKMNLETYISLISQVDALVACSTGPLHIAAALGRIAVGLYPPIRPFYPGRWAPIGEKVKVLVAHKKCSLCRKNTFCECIHNISAEEVVKALNTSIND